MLLPYIAAMLTSLLWTAVKTFFLGALAVVLLITLFLNMGFWALAAAPFVVVGVVSWGSSQRR